MFKIWNIHFLTEENVYSHYFGSSIVLDNNIPYKFSAVRIGSKYLLAYPHYYDIPEIEEEYVSVSDLFRKLCNLEYIEAQSNPNFLFQEGGNCQAFAIYVRTALTEMGYYNGFIPGKNHVCNWVVLDGDIYRIDITEKAFTKFSDKELEWIKEIELGVE